MASGTGDPTSPRGGQRAAGPSERATGLTRRSPSGNTSSRDVAGAKDRHPRLMIAALIVVLVSVIVLDIVVISRAVMRICVERGLNAEPLPLHDPRPRSPVATGFRWLEPAGAAWRGSRHRGRERHG